jgi:hypothetical protein
MAGLLGAQGDQEQVEGWDDLHSRTSITVRVIGRLKTGVTPEQATDDLNSIAAQLAKEYPETDDGQPLRLIHPGLIGDEGDVIRGFLFSVEVHEERRGMWPHGWLSLRQPQGRNL